MDHIQANDTPTTEPLSVSLSRLLRSDALILGAATLFGYAVSFAFELGVCIRYGIPVQLISLNLVNGLFVAGTLLGIVASSVYARIAIAEEIPNLSDDQWRRLGHLMTGYSALFVMSGGHINAIAAPVLLIAAVGIRSFLIRLQPRLYDHLDPDWRSKIVVRPHAWTQFVQAIPTPIYLFSVIAFFLLTIAFVLGRSGTVETPQYSYANAGNERLVLRIYNDKVIAAPYTVLRNRTSSFVWISSTGDDIVLQPGLEITELGKEPSRTLSARPSGWIILAKTSYFSGFWHWLLPWGL